MPDAAAEIYQRYLDDMSDALLSGDRKAFFRHIILPHVIETETARFVVEDWEAAKPHFDGFHKALMAQKIDTYIRIVKEAVFEDAAQTRIHGTHESFMMSSGILAVPKFSNESRLQLQDGIWGATLTRHFARYVSWPDILPRANG